MMATKKTVAAKSAAPKLKIAQREEYEKRVTKMMTDDAGGAGTFSNAALAQAFSKRVFGQDLELMDVHRAVVEGGKEVVAGDLGNIERMLYGQVVVLNGLFGECVRRASSNMGEYLQATETYMRMALKAQAQCARTAEVLGNLKNPKAVAFVKQTNISSDGGPQQVNVGVPPSVSPSREETQKPANELLEASHGNYLDTGAASKAGRGDTTLETVGTVNRPED